MNETQKRENCRLTDEVIIIHRNKDGKVLHYMDSRDWEHDSVTNVGMALAASLLGGLGAAAFTYVGIGTGTNGAAATDTVLQTQKSRLTCTPTRIQTTVANDTLQLDVTFSHATDADLTGTDAITEVGVFNASGTGANVILFRQTFASISCNWNNGDSLEMICKIQMKQGA